METRIGVGIEEEKQGNGNKRMFFRLPERDRYR